MRIALFFAGLMTALTAPAVAAANDRPCGIGTPCETATGEYHLAFPEAWDGVSPLPAVLFFHGHNSRGEAIVESQGLRSAFTERGYLLIAPTGTASPGRTALGWPARPQAEGRRDDLAFVGEVLADIERRVPLERDRILVTGFSSGGSMAWYLGCYGPGRFAGFAPVAGALRRPTPPEACPNGPLRLLHIHGFADQQVPLEGRHIREWHQGDVFESFSILRATNLCRSNPTAFETGQPFACRIWTGCGSDRDIQLCLHDGGHGLPKGWAEKALYWFENGQ